MNLSEEQLGFLPWFKGLDARVCTLTGHAGSGKTTIMGEVDKAYTALWCCPSHQAKNILDKYLLRGTAMTVASALGLLPMTVEGKREFLPIGKNRLDGQDLVIVDESSMISKQYLKWILSSSAKKIIFVGDPAQLPPVGEDVSPAFGMGFPNYHLSRVYRQAENSPILAFANDARATGHDNSRKYGIKTIHNTPENIMEFYRRYPDGVAVCPTHIEKDYSNFMARKVFVKDQKTLKKRFLPGERLFLESPVFPPDGPLNGEIVKIAEDCEPMSTAFMGFHVWEMVIEFASKRYTILVPDNSNVRKAVESKLRALAKEYEQVSSKVHKDAITREVNLLNDRIIFASDGFAMTIHKSQGSTFKDVLFFMGGLKNFKGSTLPKMAYTAITRASENLILCNG